MEFENYGISLVIWLSEVLHNYRNDNAIIGGIYDYIESIIVPNPKLYLFLGLEINNLKCDVIII